MKNKIYLKLIQTFSSINDREWLVYDIMSSFHKIFTSMTNRLINVAESGPQVAL